MARSCAPHHIHSCVRSGSSRSVFAFMACYFVCESLRCACIRAAAHDRASCMERRKFDLPTSVSWLVLKDSLRAIKASLLRALQTGRKAGTSQGDSNVAAFNSELVILYRRDWQSLGHSLGMSFKRQLAKKPSARMGVTQFMETHATSRCIHNMSRKFQESNI